MVEFTKEEVNQIINFLADVPLRYSGALNNFLVNKLKESENKEVKNA